MPRFKKAALVILVGGWLSVAAAFILPIAHMISGAAVEGLLPTENWSSSISSLVAGLFFLVLARGIRHHEKWARVVGIVAATLLLAVLPIGTMMGAYILWALITGWQVPEESLSSPVQIEARTFWGSLSSYGTAFAMASVVSIVVTRMLPVFMGLYEKNGTPVSVPLVTLSEFGYLGGLLPVPVLLLWLLYAPKYGKRSSVAMAFTCSYVILFFILMAVMYYPISQMGPRG